MITPVSKLDQIIKIERLITLKNEVKKECQRRCYIGSVASYGSSTWDYTNSSSTTVPTTDKEIQVDHYNKISIPLRKINWTKMPNGPFNRDINDYDLLEFETTLAALSTRKISSTVATDCSESCTGTCTTYCDNTCYGDCDGRCGDVCTGTCSDTCSGSCVGKCSKKCSGRTCQAACSICTCGDGCVGHCVSSCGATDTCAETCASNCHGGCAAECATGCGGSCFPCGCTPWYDYE